ncbi:MAG: sigma-70 family RNA polymerase sigma factor [Planctomycetia bacterium]|nr:sigma-70 family RNA polymerase sigma factor [Planctomycetia bacterium]
MTIDKNSSVREKAMQLFLNEISFVQFLAMVHAPDESLQEDIVNDVFVEFVTKAETWDLTTPKPLLRKIVENVSKRYWRKRTESMPETLRKIAEHIRSVTEEESEDEKMTLKAQTEAMNLCLAKLTKEQRELIIAHYYDGIKVPVLAEKFKLNVNTVYSMITRIRAALRNCIMAVLKGWAQS